MTLDLLWMMRWSNRASHDPRRPLKQYIVRHGRRRRSRVAQHALYQGTHGPKPSSRREPVMPSSEMNYCHGRIEEPLRTNLSPWMAVPRVKGSEEKHTFTRELKPIVLRIPPPGFSFWRAQALSCSRGRKKILLGVGRLTRKKKKMFPGGKCSKAVGA